MKFDIKKEDIADIFNYYEAVEKKQKTKQIDDIEKILNKETGRSGRKSASFTVIQQLKEKQMNEIAIYVGIILANMNIKPKWTVDEIINILNKKSFIDKELIPLLSNDYLADKDLTTPELKSIAIKIQENIVKNEKKTIENVRNLIKNKRRDPNTIFAHQLNRKQLTSIRNAIIISLRILKEATKDFNISDFLNYTVSKDDINNSTFHFINKLIGNSKIKSNTNSLLNEVTVLLPDLIELRDSKKITNIDGKKKLSEWIDNLRKAKNIFERMSEKTIIWPEADKSITNEKSLKLYFQQLELGREKAQKVIQQYKKKNKAITNITTGNKEDDDAMASGDWSYEKVISLVNKTAKKMATEKQYVGAEQGEVIAETDQKAQELLDNNNGLEAFISQEHPDVIGELSSLLASRIQSNKAKMGRPSKI